MKILNEKLESARLDDEAVKEINGGTYGAGGGFSSNTVDYNDVQGHFGTPIDRYETGKYIGQKVIIRNASIMGDRYYVGTLKKSVENDYYFFTIRHIVITCENGRTETFDFSNNVIWLYV